VWGGCHFYRFVNQKLLNVFNETPKGSYDFDIENYKNKVNEIQIISKNKNIQFFVVFHPNLVNYSNQEYKSDLKRYNKYKEIFFELNSTFFELIHDYRNYDSLKLRVKENDSAHLSKFGHNITAEALYDFFEPKFVDIYQAQT